MLVQLCKLAGYSPIVGVVGGSHKVEHCYSMGADVVLDKAAIKLGSGGGVGDGVGDGVRGIGSGSGDLNTEIMLASRTHETDATDTEGYIAIFDANGLDSLAHSFNQLSQNGRLIIYGFHSNLPKGVHALSPIRWLRMAYGLLSMPRFDPMAMVLESKAVMG